MFCPRCQRPLEDAADGAYICCAGESLRWRCAQCAKVSEGFAFPYGRCPHCAGKLEMLDARGADDAAAIEGIRMAFEIELGGRAFYQRAAAECRDADLRRLFGRFALMEGEHLEALSRRYHLDVPPLPAPDVRVEVAAIFAGVESRPRDPATLFRIAVGLERRAARFFADRAAAAPAGSAQRQLFNELAAEELDHAALLATELERWRSGKPGLFGIDPLGGGAAARDANANAAVVLLDGHDARRPALLCGGATLDRGALRERVARAAAVLQAHGVGPGDRVAIRLPDGFDAATALLGAMWAGAVAVAVDPRMPAAEWHGLLDAAGFAAIVAERDDDTPAPWRERVLAVDAYRAALQAAEPLAAQPVDADSPAFWCRSSGASGPPGLVVHAHRFAQRIEQVARDALGIGAADRMLAGTNLSDAGAFANALCAGLKLGAAVILEPRPADVGARIAALQPTVLFGDPALYDALLRQGRAEAVAAAGARVCVSVGAALAPALRDEWQRRTGLALVDGYVAAEAPVPALIDRGDGLGFVAAPGVDVRPLHDVAPGVPTRLCIAGPAVALGYLDRPQQHADAFRDGAFCTADLFTRVAGGGWRLAAPANAASDPVVRSDERRRERP